MVSLFICPLWPGRSILSVETLLHERSMMYGRGLNILVTSDCGYVLASISGSSLSFQDFHFHQPRVVDAISVEALDSRRS